ncbi:MAG: InlB B-repeat-containing protein [Clostridiales Family XIII bacterium]|nr:InlB B-repeat-containing protein [Clostridiales Family XIII bacterium]
MLFVIFSISALIAAENGYNLFDGWFSAGAEDPAGTDSVAADAAQGEADTAAGTEDIAAESEADAAAGTETDAEAQAAESSTVNTLSVNPLDADTMQGYAEQTPGMTAAQVNALSQGVDEEWWKVNGSYSWMWSSYVLTGCEETNPDYPRWVQYTGNDANYVDLLGAITHIPQAAPDGHHYYTTSADMRVPAPALDDAYTFGGTIPRDGAFSEAEPWIDINSDGENAQELPKVASTAGDGSTVYSDEYSYYYLRMTYGAYASVTTDATTGRSSYYNVNRGSITIPNPTISVTINDEYFYELTSFGADKVWDASDDVAWTKMLKRINTLKVYDAAAQRWFLDADGDGVYDPWYRGGSTANPTRAGETWISEVDPEGDGPIVVGGYDITAELASIEANPDQIIPAYIDANGNGAYDLYTEPYMDWNRNGKWDAHYGPELMTGAVIHEYGCPLFGSNVRPTYAGAVATGQDDNWKINGNGIFKMHNSAASADSSDQMFNYAVEQPFSESPVLLGNAARAYVATMTAIAAEYLTGPGINSGAAQYTVTSGSGNSLKTTNYIIPMSAGNGGNVSAIKAASNAGSLPGGLNNWVLHPWSFSVGTTGKATAAAIAQTDTETSLAASGYNTKFATSGNTGGATNYVWQPVWRQYYGGQYNANAEFTGNSTRTTASLFYNDPTLAQVFFAQSRATYDGVNNPADTLNGADANRNMLSYESAGSAAGDTASTDTEARVSRALGETPLLVKDAARYLLPRFDGAFPKIGGTAEGVSYIADVSQYFGANTDIGPDIQSVLLDYTEAENRITQSTPVGSRTYWTFGYDTQVTGSYPVAASSSYHMASIYGNTPVNNAANGYGTSDTASNAWNTSAATYNPTGWIGGDNAKTAVTEGSPTLNSGAYPFYQPLSINTGYTKAEGWQDASAVTGTDGVDMASMEASPVAKTSMGQRSAGFANLNSDTAVSNGTDSALRYPIIDTLYGQGNGTTTGVSNAALWIDSWNRYFTGGIVQGDANVKANAPYTNTGNGATLKVETEEITAEPAVTISPAAVQPENRYTVGFYTQDWIYMGSEVRDPAAGMPMQVWNAGDASGWTSSSAMGVDNSLPATATTATDRLGVANSAAKASVYATYQNNWGYSGGWPDSYWSYLGDQRIMKSDTGDAKKALTDPTDAFGRWSATTYNDTTYAASLQPSDISYGQGANLSAASSYKYPNLYYKGSVPAQAQASGNSNAATLSMGTATGTAWSDIVWRRNWVYGYGFTYGTANTSGQTAAVLGFPSSGTPSAQLPTDVEIYANLSYGGNLMYTQNSLAWYSRSLPTMWWRGPLGNAYDPDGQDKDGMIWMGGESTADALNGASTPRTADIGEGIQNKYNYINTFGNNKVASTADSSSLGYLSGYNIISRTNTNSFLTGYDSQSGVPQNVSYSTLSYASAVVRNRQNYDASAETSVYYVADDVKLRYAYAAGREQEPVQHYFYSLSPNMYNFDHTDYNETNDDTFEKYTINGYLNNALENKTTAATATMAALYASKNVKAEDSEYSQMTNLRTGDLLPSTEINYLPQSGVSGTPASGTLIEPDTTVALLKDEYGRDPADPYEDVTYWYSVKMMSIESATASPYTGLTRSISEMYTNDYVGDSPEVINETNTRQVGNGDDFAVLGMSQTSISAADQGEIGYTGSSTQPLYNATGTFSGGSGFWQSEETGYMGTVAYTGLSVSGKPLTEALPFGNVTLTQSNAAFYNTDPITGGIQAHDLYLFNASNALGSDGGFVRSLYGYIANDYNFVRTGPLLRTVGQQLEMNDSSSTEYEKVKPYSGQVSGLFDSNPYPAGENRFEMRLYTRGENSSQYLANWTKGWRWSTARSEKVTQGAIDWNDADGNGIKDADEEYVNAAFIVAGSGHQIALSGANHIQDGYHIVNLGATVSGEAIHDPATASAPSHAVDLGSAADNTDHNTDWLYDNDGDGIVGLNESYANPTAAALKVDTQTGKVYDSYTIPADIPTRAGLNFIGYRLIVVDTGYDMNVAETFWKTSTATTTTNPTGAYSQAAPAAYKYGVVPDNPNTPDINESYGAAYVMSAASGQTMLVDTGGGQILVQPGDEILGVAQGRAYKNNTLASTSYTNWVYGEPKYDPVTHEFLGYVDANDGDGDGDREEWLDYYEYDGVPYETPAWEIRLIPVWGPVVFYTDRNDGGWTQNLPPDLYTSASGLDDYGIIDDYLPVEAGGAGCMLETGYAGYTIPAYWPTRLDGAIFQGYRVYVDNMDYTDEEYVYVGDYLPGELIPADVINNQTPDGSGTDTIPGNVRLVAIWRMPVIYTDNINDISTDTGIDVDRDGTTKLTAGALALTDEPGKDILVPSNLWDSTGKKFYDDLTMKYYYPYFFHEYAVPATESTMNEYLEPRFADTAEVTDPTYPEYFPDYLDTTQPDYGKPTPEAYAAGYFFIDNPGTAFDENPKIPEGVHAFPDFEWDHWFVRSGPAQVAYDYVDNDGLSATGAALTNVNVPDNIPDALYDLDKVKISKVRGTIYVTGIWRYAVRYNERYIDAYDLGNMDDFGNIAAGQDGYADVQNLPPDEVSGDYSGALVTAAAVHIDYIDDFVYFYTDYVSGSGGATPGQGWFDEKPEYSIVGPGYQILSTTNASISNETPTKVGAVFEYYTVQLGGIFGDNEAFEDDPTLRHTIMADDMTAIGIVGNPVAVNDEGLTGAQKFYPGDIVPWELFLKYKGRIILTPHWKDGSVLYLGNESSVGENPGDALYIPDHWEDTLLDPPVNAAYEYYFKWQDITTDSAITTMSSIIGTNAFHTKVGVTFGIQWHDPKHRGGGVFNDGLSNATSPPDEPVQPFFQDGDWEESSMNIPQLSGYSFLGWNTKSDGSGDWYYPADHKIDATTTNPGIVPAFLSQLPPSYTLPAGSTRYALTSGSAVSTTEYGVVFYAIWDPPMVQYHFQGGSNTGGEVFYWGDSSSSTVLDLMKDKAVSPTSGGVVGEYIIPEGMRPGGTPDITRTGFIFVGWNTESDASGDWYTADGTSTGDYSATIHVPAGTTAHLYAIWARAGDVYYHANGDAPGDPSETMYGGYYDDIHITDIPLASFPGFTGKETVALGFGYKVRPYNNASPAAVTYPQWPLTLYPDGEYHNGHFTGWNTESDGTGIAVPAGTVYPIRYNTEFFAQWENWITYHANAGGDPTVTDIPAGTVDGHDVVAHKGSYQVHDADLTDTSPLDDIPTRTGYQFLGWSEDPTATVPAIYFGQTFPVVLHDIDLYAVWQINHYTVWFTDGYTDGLSYVSAFNDADLLLLSSGSSTYHDMQGGIPHGGAAITPATNPTRPGYVFVGWSMSPADYSFITQDMYIYALWEPAGGRDDDDDDDGGDNPPGPGPFGPDGVPITGDDSNFLFCLWVMIISAATMLLAAAKRRQFRRGYVGQDYGRRFK